MKSQILLVLLIYLIGCEKYSKEEIVEQVAIHEDCIDKAENSQEFCSYLRITSYINRTFEYPQLAKENRIEGSQKVVFEITKEGEVGEIKFMEVLGYGIEEEVERILRSLPKFIPGKRDEILIITKRELEFNFKIGEIPIDPVYQVLDRKPLSKGCETIPSGREAIKCSEEKMEQFVHEHLKYPKEAVKNKIEGRVYIQFVVSKIGEIGHAHIVREIGFGCGEEGLRLVNLLPKMEPGVNRGRKVRSIYNLGIDFKLWNERIE